MNKLSQAAKRNKNQFDEDYVSMIRKRLVEAASLMGKIGGKRGTGKVKRRSKAHYRMMAEARRKKK